MLCRIEIDQKFLLSFKKGEGSWAQNSYQFTNESTELKEETKMYLSIGCPFPDDEGVVLLHVAAHLLEPERKVLDAALVILDPGHDVLVVAIPGQFIHWHYHTTKRALAL